MKDLPNSISQFGIVGCVKETQNLCFAIFGNTPQEQARTEDSCSKSLAEDHQAKKPRESGDVYGFQTSGITANDLQPVKNDKL